MLSNKLKYSWAPFIVYCTIFYLCCIFIPSSDDSSGFPPHFDKLVHFFMYFGLTITSAMYYIYDKKQLVNVKQLIAWAFILPVLYGGLIEIIQDQFIEGRGGDWGDFVADTFGSISGIFVALRYRDTLLLKQLIKK